MSNEFIESKEAIKRLLQEEKYLEAKLKEIEKAKLKIVYILRGDKEWLLN